MDSEALDTSRDMQSGSDWNDMHKGRPLLTGLDEELKQIRHQAGEARMNEYGVLEIY